MNDHCQEINRCNQRGGRMLSIIDLLDSNSLSETLAVYLLAAVNRKAASFMVGANPGGAGKTTVMGALLNLVPSAYKLATADSLQTLENARSGNGTSPKCWICHEISSGPYYAYLWGAEARAFFAMADYGHMLATNLHADTYQEAYNQICHDNGVPPRYFYKIKLQLYLKLERIGSRRIARKINTVYESDGESEHRLIYSSDDAFSPNPAAVSRLVSELDFQNAQNDLQRLRAAQARRIEEVRAVLA